VFRFLPAAVLLSLLPVPGQAQISVWAPGQVVLDENEPGRLLGKVTDRSSGEALGGLRLVLLRPALSTGRTFPEPWVAHGSDSRALTVAQVTTARDGSFRFEGLSVGRYLLRARAALKGSAGEEANLSVEHPVRTVSLALDLGRSLSGTVVDAQGKPLPGLFVLLAGLDLGDGRNALDPDETAPWTRSDRDGHFTLAQLPEGILHVQAVHKDYGFSLPQAVGADEIQGHIELSVPDERVFLDPLSRSGGIGVSLSFSTRGPKLSRVVPDLPAYRAGLLVGDLVVSIDGRPTPFMTRMEFINRCRGKAGSTVVLRIERAGRPLEFQLQRAVLPY
jgi:hypothetical protein